MENAKFLSPHDWDKFSAYILEQNRYILNRKWERFIETVLLTAKKRERYLNEGMKLYRARIGAVYPKDQEYPYPEPLSPSEIKAPPKDKAVGGRVNPVGMSYLYLASNIDTAIAEIRPWLDADVTVGEFLLIKNILVVDVSQDRKFSKEVTVTSKEPVEPWEQPSEEWESYGWRDINKSFSEPVRVGEEYRNYIPTQYLAECFKKAGYEGIVYKSAFREDGYNVVLFEPESACLVESSRRLCYVKFIKYKYEELPIGKL